MVDLSQVEKIEIIEKVDAFDLNKGHHFRLAEIDLAIEFAEKIIEEAKKGDFNYIIKEQRKFIDKYGVNFYAKERILEVKTASKELKDNFDTFLTQNELSEAHNIAHDFQQKYKEYLEEFPEAFPDAEYVFSKDKELRKEIEKFENLLKQLEKGLEDSQMQNFFEAAIYNCEKIIKLCKENNREDLVEKYEKLLAKIKKDLEDYLQAKKKEQEMLATKAAEFEQLINIDELTLPLVEEFAVNDILGDLSDDVNEVLTQLDSLLQDHRAEVKDEIYSKTMLKSASGEIRESDQNIQVQKSEKEDEPLKYNILSGFENPFMDTIEEAIITDLIPYNFEINTIELNGKLVKELPDYDLTKDGLELKWNMNKIRPKEKVEISYDLRRRVSRTIIFIIKDEVKIIKTHSNLNPLDLEGLYDAKLPFTNPYKEILNAVVVEDLIPLYYVHFIKIPRKILPDNVSEAKNGQFVKWNIGNMEPITMDYHYKLLELYKNEELKIAMNKLNEEAIEELKKGNNAKALKNFKIIREHLNSVIK